MSSTFGGISTALSALYTQRRALDLTGQNIANANTDGYSRQRLELQAMEGSPNPARYSTGDPIGSGVKIGDVTRVRDEFLENRARTERGLNEYLSGQKAIYTRVEQVIGEPSDTGLQSQLSEMWSAWHDVANRPGDGAARSQILHRAETVADTFATKHDGLSSLWDSTREQLDTSLTETNAAADAVAELNHRIVLADKAGLPTNELSDQRDLKALRLSELTGGNVRRRDDGSIDVLISGAALVSGDDARHLVAVGGTDMNDQINGTKVAINWAGTTTAASISSGAISATMETLSTTLPTMSQNLDKVAAQLVTQVNTAHKNGFDLTGAAGVDFFSGTTADTIKVALTKSDQVAASGDVTARYDGANATALGDQSRKPDGTDVQYRQFVVDIGVSSQTVQRRADIQHAITQDIDSARTAESGVNLDEEMTNLLQFQRAYEAAAKVMSVVDSTLDTLINMKR